MKYFIILLLLVSCAGYRLQEKNNPFSQYGINSISIPMFYNKSNLSNISASMTNKVYIMLSKFKGLKIHSGDEEADAVLIGIITAEDKLSNSKRGTNLRSVKNATGDLIGENRGDFYIPSKTEVGSRLRLILLKNPSKEEIKLMQSSLGKFTVSSKVILNESIDLNQSFTREIYDNESVVVVNTQNRSAVKKSIDDMASTAAETFRDMIIYAF